MHSFYARIRQDEVLGPIFNGLITDWDQHLAKLVDFWSAILRRTARFSGAPMPKHAALPGLSLELFERWLGLFQTRWLSSPTAPWPIKHSWRRAALRKACGQATR